MTGAMYAAIGGLKTHMSNMNVIGNNIANVNTQSYKAQRMTFQESIYVTSRAGSDGTVSSGGNNPSQVGYGAQVGSIDLNMSPGTYSPTGYDLDCMISGEGFFLVGDKDIGNSVNGSADLSNFELTRMGDFWVDANGYVCDRRGKCVYGFAMVQNPYFDVQRGESKDNPKTIPSTELVPLRVPLAAAKPLNGENWEEGDPVYNILSSADITNNNARSNFSVGDLLENVYRYARQYATSQANTALNDPVTFYYGTAPTGGAGGTQVALNTLMSSAQLQEFETALGLTPNVDNLSVEIDFSQGSIIGVNSITLPTGYNQQDNASLPASGTGTGTATTANTYNWPIPNGENQPIKLTGMSINKQGAITGTAGNGQTVTVGYVAVANAAANDGVTHIDGYYYKAMEGAGDLQVSVLGNGLEEALKAATGKSTYYMNNKFQGPAAGTATGAVLAETIPPSNDRIEAGGDSEIRNGGLEASTADVATEFANMILTQRGYQANTRMVTVTDSMLEELVNMKR